MEREGLFGLLDDVNAGKVLASEPLDLAGSFARFATRKSEQENRDVVDERFHRSLTARAVMGRTHMQNGSLASEGLLSLRADLLAGKTVTIRPFDLLGIVIRYRARAQ
jgi:hypothetical protein